MSNLKSLTIKILKLFLIYAYFHKVYRYSLEIRWQKNYSKNRRKIINQYSDEKYLNIGGGRFLKHNWRILDYVSPQYQYDNDLIDYNINLLENTKWPIEDSSFDLVYTSHCLEHLPDNSGINVFKEAYRILKQDGVFRITLPDIDLAYEAYKNKDVVFFLNETNAKDKSTITSQFLDFFTSYSPKDININEFENDFLNLEKELFLNKYIPSKINSEVHDFSTHITWYNTEKIKRMGMSVNFSKAIISKRHNSISEEMKSPEFDHKPFKSALYVDLIK